MDKKLTSILNNKWLGYGLIAIPVCIYFAVVLKYAVNIPSQDDYGASLQFLCKYRAAATAADKFFLLFIQHNEHRIASSRLIYLIYYKLLGSLNFVHLIVLANLQLVLILGIATGFIKRASPGFWIIPSLLLSICLFDVNSWENADFAMAGMQNYGVILWFMAALLFYSKSSKWLPLAIFFQVLCIFSSGNGIIATLVLIAYNILAKNKVNAILAVVFGAVCSCLYFVHYMALPSTHPAFDIVRIAGYFLNIAGAHWSIDAIVQRAIGAVLCIAGLLFVIRVKLDKRYLQLLAIAGFLIATMAEISVFRSGMPGNTSFSSRYLVYPNFLFALIIGLWLMKSHDKPVALPLSILSIGLAVYISIRNFDQGIGGFRYLNNILQTTDYYFPEQGKSEAKAISDQSCQFGIYCIDEHRKIPGPKKAN